MTGIPDLKGLSDEQFECSRRLCRENVARCKAYRAEQAVKKSPFLSNLTIARSIDVDVAIVEAARRKFNVSLLDLAAA